MGLGVGWMVELKLNRKEKLDSNGWVATPLSPQDPLLIKEQHNACF